jgi:dihydroneopterin aldolase / 2-amino-4-hydroxy-6-hydroxymethyldihydropteridine diphosphokinase / dihydropteroate synthase
MILKVIKSSYCFTLEALASKIAVTVLKVLNEGGFVAHAVRVQAEKPKALPSGVARVEVIRTVDHCPSTLSPPISISSNFTPSLAVLSIGSNIQPRFEHINRALLLLGGDTSALRILDSSFMYDTTPMYVTDQDRFANCALLVRTSSLSFRKLHILSSDRK